MDIYKASAIASKMKGEKGLYDKVARFFRGDRKGLSKTELKAMKKVVEFESKILIDTINDTIQRSK